MSRILAGGGATCAAAALFVISVFATTGSGREAVRRPAAFGYADGAAPGFSGGFGESACDACHFEAAVNTKPGQLTLGGVPERFVAGERYPITITLTRPGMAMAGFQLAARMENGGTQAGTLAPGPGEEKRIKIEPGAVQYANQREEGTTLTEPGIAKWAVIWTAPQTADKVLFHAAANAADKDGAARGDYIYTAVGQAQPAN